jgi:phosphoglycerate dehydrogenase-like enzyme
VIGTKRQSRGPLPTGFVQIGGPGDLDQFLADADFVAVCCQWTPDTTNLIDAHRLAAMKPGVVLVNVARGEIVDEAALADALARGHLRGVVLDVYVGEFERPPPEVLQRDPRVLITPHISGASDENRHGAIELFCENLRAYLDGKPLRNVIDWDVGY